MVKESKKQKAGKIRTYIVLGLITVALIAFCYNWYKDYNSYEKTDDAYIDADRVSVSSKIMGRIANIHAAEGDDVKEGALLIELDSTDLVAQRLQAETAIQQAETSARQSSAKFLLDQKSIKVQEVNLERSKEDFDRATIQLKGNVITKEQYDHIKKAFESAQAQLEVAKAQLELSKTQIASSDQAINMAKSQLNTIQTQLQNSRIIAPISGRIAKRWLLPGDIAQPGQAIFTITRNDSIYVTAFFEETKIASLHLGQKIEFTVDAYPGVLFNGAITYIASNTAAQFSLIPANNASGNFTKVTQRIPIRMSVLGSDNNGKYPELKLIAGMSVYVKIPH